MELSHCTTCEGTHPPLLDACCPFPPQGPQPTPPRRVTRQTRHPLPLSPPPPSKSGRGGCRGRGRGGKVAHQRDQTPPPDTAHKQPDPPQHTDHQPQPEPRTLNLQPSVIINLPTRRQPSSRGSQTHRTSHRHSEGSHPLPPGFDAWHLLYPLAPQDKFLSRQRNSSPRRRWRTKGSLAPATRQASVPTPGVTTWTAPTSCTSVLTATSTGLTSSPTRSQPARGKPASHHELWTTDRRGTPIIA